MRVLGIDLAGSWKDTGSALLALTDDGARVLEVRPGAIAWPGGAFSPAALAERIDRFARAEGVVAIALDGPRAPASLASARGVGT